ncbi:hypothetical protein B0H10DRAFT_1953226 [Mycena sp. CBHHK59/15]|nr:hypothetical protein B0H10DRAFT_1953226 [Mycena sp. CBHHK59/15]
MWYPFLFSNFPKNNIFVVHAYNNDYNFFKCSSNLKLCWSGPHHVVDREFNELAAELRWKWDTRLAKRKQKAMEPETDEDDPANRRSTQKLLSVEQIQRNRQRYQWAWLLDGPSG